MEFRIANTFNAAWGRLSAPEQKAAKTTAFDLQIDPSTPGLKFDASYAFDPLAKIETVHLYGTNVPTYLVTVDAGIGMGSYAGFGTNFMEVRKGRLIQLPIVVYQSLKNEWRIVPAPRGAVKTIEFLRCHPNWDNPDWDKTGEFVVEYSAFRFRDGEWQKRTREQIGFWEDDNPWPPHAAFP